MSVVDFDFPHNVLNEILIGLVFLLPHVHDSFELIVHRHNWRLDLLKADHDVVQCFE